MWYEAKTEGVLVQVRPRFLLEHSDVGERRFAFGYRVRLENGGPEPVRLLFRHWHVHDSIGMDSEIDGEGVIGKQPLLEPGGGHEYESFCVLESPVGYMEGYYTFSRPRGDRFRVEIPRFQLRAPLPPPDAGTPHDQEGPTAPRSFN